MRRFITLILLLLSFSVFTVQAWQIVEFCPDTYLPDDSDEYLVLEGSGALDGITVSDGEGSFRFSPMAHEDERIIIAREGRAFFKVHGIYPDFELYDTLGEVPDVVRVGRFQMANAADELMLYGNSVLLQKVSWPADVRAREGQIHYLEYGLWDPRPLFLGQTRLAPITVSNATILAFASPDSASSAFAEAVKVAEQEILVNVYLFTNRRQAEQLIGAAERGVDVQVLIDGSPVGGLPDESKRIACLLNRSGIPVFQIKDPGEARKRYRFDHAKYMVIDRKAVFITSENFDQNGFPEAGERGNRGWGVLIWSGALAEYFADLYLADLTGYDIFPAEMDCMIPAVTSDLPYNVKFPARVFDNATVTAVISPDTSTLILDLIAEAESSIEIEQAYIRNWSGNTPNPYLEAVLNASRRGVRVRVLLDSFWFNTEGGGDNDEMVSYINGIANNEGIPLEARLVSLESSGVEKIHNKGMIVDGKRVLISSINWNENSPLYNREAGVIVESEGVAEYFLAVFEYDWSSAEHAVPRGVDMIKLGVAIAVILMLVLWCIQKRRSRVR